MKNIILFVVFFLSFKFNTQAQKSNTHSVGNFYPIYLKKQILDTKNTITNLDGSKILINSDSTLIIIPNKYGEWVCPTKYFVKILKKTN